MARLELTPRFCQNKLCREKFTAGEVATESWNPDQYFENSVCPKCGMKTGARIDKLGLGEVMEQAVKDHPELLDLNLFKRN